MAALDNVVDLKRLSVIAREGEADGIGGTGGDVRALAAGVAEIAKRQARFVRFGGMAGIGEAQAGEGIAERQGIFGAAIPRARMGRAEAGAGHLRRVS